MSCLDGGGYRPAEQIRAEAVKFSANLRQAGALAIAIDNALRLIDNYKMQRDISNRGLAISEGQQNHLKTTFWPRELEFLAEFGNPDDVEDATVLGRRYAGRLSSMVAGGFAKQLKAADCKASRYCTSDRSKRMQDLLLVRSEALANARILGRMIGFAEVQARRDRNDDRRRQAAALGRGLLGQAASLLDKAGGGLANAGQSIATSLNSALETFGYGFKDPGISPEMQAMRFEASQYNRMPPPPNQGYNPYDMGPRNIQYDSIDDFLSQNGNTAAQAVGQDAISLSQNPSNTPMGSTQAERWNEADVGNRNLARTGSKTYDFVDSRGDRGRITVSMSDFPLQFVDDKNPGDP